MSCRMAWRMVLSLSKWPSQPGSQQRDTGRELRWPARAFLMPQLMGWDCSCLQRTMFWPRGQVKPWSLCPLFLLQKHIRLCPRSKPTIKSICNNLCKVARKLCCCIHFTSNKLKVLPLIFSFLTTQQQQQHSLSVWNSSTEHTSWVTAFYHKPLTAEAGEINNTVQLSKSAEAVQGSSIETHQVFIAGKAAHLINAWKKPLSLICQTHWGATCVVRESDRWRNVGRKWNHWYHQRGKISAFSIIIEPWKTIALQITSWFWTHSLHKYTDPAQRQKRIPS